MHDDDKTDKHVLPDPASVWWGPAFRSTRPAPPPQFPPPADDVWRWRYSWLTGIMYGPIPVGLLIASLLLLLRYR